MHVVDCRLFRCQAINWTAAELLSKRKVRTNLGKFQPRYNFYLRQRIWKCRQQDIGHLVRHVLLEEFIRAVKHWDSYIDGQSLDLGNSCEVWVPVFPMAPKLPVGRNRVLHTFRNVRVPYPTMHHFLTEMCTRVQNLVTNGALWDIC